MLEQVARHGRNDGSERPCPKGGDVDAAADLAPSPEGPERDAEAGRGAERDAGNGVGNPEEKASDSSYVWEGNRRRKGGSYIELMEEKRSR